MTEGAEGKDDREAVEASQSQLDQIKEILRRVDCLPVVDTRPDDEILGYD
jgi:hypothetical protein